MAKKVLSKEQCIICDKDFNKLRHDQKTCGSNDCKRLLRNISGKAWRKDHPDYQSNYMKSYRQTPAAV